MSGTSKRSPQREGFPPAAALHTKPEKFMRAYVFRVAVALKIKPYPSSFSYCGDGSVFAHFWWVGWNCYRANSEGTIMYHFAR
jgi:hypothetical protein